MEGWGALGDCRYLLHDRDTKYTHSFQAIIDPGHVQPLVLPARSPNLNAYAERWIRSAADSAPLADTQSNQFPDNRSDDRGQLAISAPA
jgi:hypothetical protein